MTNFPIKKYFDYAATSPLNEDLFLQSYEKFKSAMANPSSTHGEGIRAKKLLEEARQSCADSLGIKPGQIVFTSGGTESDHWPFLSLLQRPAGEGGKRGSILVSETEHAAVREQAFVMGKQGFDIITVPPTADGIITAEAVEKRLRRDTVLVCVHWVNNETGAIQPIAEIGKMLKDITSGKAKFHVDAVQAVGKIPFVFDNNISSAAISAHKIGGMRGCGILFLQNRQEAFLRGGGQEGGLRSGTENVFSAYNLSLCLKDVIAKQEKKYGPQQEILEKFIVGLKELNFSVIPESRASNPQLFSPWILQAASPKLPGQVLVRALSEQGFYISTGSACSATKESRPVLKAMNVPPKVSLNGVRFSFGYETSLEDVNSLLDALRNI